MLFVDIYRPDLPFLLDLLNRFLLLYVAPAAVSWLGFGAALGGGATTNQEHHLVERGVRSQMAPWFMDGGRVFAFHLAALAATALLTAAACAAAVAAARRRRCCGRSASGPAAPPSKRGVIRLPCFDHQDLKIV